MKAMTNDEFAEAVLHKAEPATPFKPQVTYIPEGDCLEFVASNDDYYAERIDGLVTVYYSRETNEVMGSLIKGVRQLCAGIAERCPGFAIEIEAGKVKLGHLFLAHLWTRPRNPDDILVKTYRKLIQIAEESDVAAELCST